MKTPPLTPEQQTQMASACKRWNDRMGIRPRTPEQQAQQKAAQDTLMLRHIEQFPRMQD